MFKLAIYFLMFLCSLKLTNHAVDYCENRVKFSSASAMAWVVTVVYGLMM